MKILFWVSLAVVAYTYIGYFIYLWIRSRVMPHPVRKAPMEPAVSVVIAVHNEEVCLPEKLRNLSLLEYPQNKLEIIIASDASTDRTNSILEAAQQSSPLRIVSVQSSIRGGKAAALSNAIEKATGEILLFTDVRQTIEPSAMRELAANFADPSVGCVSGELMFRRGSDNCEGVSAYWRFEKVIRKLEASVGSVAGATGAIYAARRRCVVPPPPGTLLDDVYIPACVARSGLRVVFEPAARAWDSPIAGNAEFRRKVRTLAGNYQLLQLAPWLLTQANPMRWAFVSHKLLRLAVPFLLVSALLANTALIATPLYLAFLTGQVCLYVLALLGFVLPFSVMPKPCSVASAFVLLNAAAFVAPFEYFLHRKDLTRIWRHLVFQPITGGTGQ